MKILVVDDMPINCIMVENVLSYAGHEVVSVHSGKEALALLEQEEIQLLIVDWMMPHMTGIELVQRIRSDYADPYRYIIMLTAKDSQEDMLTGLEAGADDYMARPYSPRELEARVAIGTRVINLESSMKTTLRQIERAKKEWEATIDSIPQLVCLVDRENRIQRANSTVEDWGLAWVNEVKDMPLHDLLRNVYPGFAETLRTTWEAACEELAKGLEYECEGLDGTRGHYFHAQYEPIDPFNEIDLAESSFAAVAISDITERKQLEIALQEAKEQLEIEHQKSESLLLNILPESIAERLKSGEKTIAESFDDVSVMFVDLVGFTPLSMTTPPAQLITMLNQLFSIFDDIADKHGLEKIKTIGDSYMAVSGLPIAQPDHADRIARAALDIQRALGQFNQKYNQNLNIRIGIDSGPVVAGVIGRKKFIYDLWGDTVNTASRMESHGVTGQIQVSEPTHALLKNRYQFERRGPIEVKGKGMVLTYILTGQTG